MAAYEQVIPDPSMTRIGGRCCARHQPFKLRTTNAFKMERISREENPVAQLVAKWASDKRMVSRVYGAAFLLRAARARARNLRSPRFTYST
jgi:hypothetical protein